MLHQKERGNSCGLCYGI